MSNNIKKPKKGGQGPPCAIKATDDNETLQKIWESGKHMFAFH
jgi:hypothetical protein